MIFQELGNTVFRAVLPDTLKNHTPFFLSSFFEEYAIILPDGKEATIEQLSFMTNKTK